MRLRRDKCYFMLPQVQYLGHIISRRGIQPTEEKVEAIQNALTPTNVHQLKSFLGFLNFYSKFLPRAATRLAPFYLLLQKRQPWTWGPPRRQAFQAAKHLLTSSALLAHYSDQKEFTVACRVRNNVRPSAIFRAFRDNDRPNCCLLGKNGRAMY